MLSKKITHSFKLIKNPIAYRVYSDPCVYVFFGFSGFLNCSNAASMACRVMVSLAGADNALARELRLYVNAVLNVSSDISSGKEASAARMAVN